MAQISNIISNDRHKLQDVIPLSTPYTISIDPSNLCNFKCKFCATHSSKDNSVINKQVMDFDLFKKIIDDLKEFDHKIKVLRITGNGEPLINKRLPDMIKYAKNSGIANFIEIITNGSLLEPKLNRKLISSGIDRIRISVESLTDVGYQNITGVKIDFNKYIENIKDLYDNRNNCEIYVKIMSEVLKTEKEKQDFYNLFDNKCDRMFIDNVIPLWSDFDELNNKFNIDYKGMHGQSVQNIQVCPFIFYMIYINSNGEVTSCCADWKREFILGNVNNNSVKEIWDSNRLKGFWIDMLEGKKNNYKMCKKCLYPQFDCNDNIDKYANEILKKLGKKGE